MVKFIAWLFTASEGAYAFIVYPPALVLATLMVCADTLHWISWLQYGFTGLFLACFIMIVLLGLGRIRFEKDNSE
jgi:hypothetical protein